MRARIRFRVAAKSGFQRARMPWPLGQTPCLPRSPKCVAAAGVEADLLSRKSGGPCQPDRLSGQADCPRKAARSSPSKSRTTSQVAQDARLRSRVPRPHTPVGKSPGSRPSGIVRSRRQAALGAAACRSRSGGCWWGVLCACRLKYSHRFEKIGISLARI